MFDFFAMIFGLIGTYILTINQEEINKKELIVFYFYSISDCFLIIYFWIIDNSFLFILYLVYLAVSMKGIFGYYYINYKKKYKEDKQILN
jgi:hypothetical protein